jgi:hypothetical protein
MYLMLFIVVYIAMLSVAQTMYIADCRMVSEVELWPDLRKNILEIAWEETDKNHTHPQSGKSVSTTGRIQILM